MLRRIALGVLLGVASLLLVDAALVRMGLAAGVIPRIAGTSPWITSRAAGLTAFAALSLDVVFGLFVSTGAADRLLPRARSMDVHRWLSTVALGMTSLHALVLLADRYVQFDLFDLLVPFVSTHRVFAVALGVLAAYGAVLVHVSFVWRRRIGPKVWRRVHYLSFFVFVAALLHGLLAGSGSGLPGVQALYVSSATAVILLGSYRVFRTRARARQATRAPLATMAHKSSATSRMKP